MHKRVSGIFSFALALSFAGSAFAQDQPPQGHSQGRPSQEAYSGDGRRLAVALPRVQAPAPVSTRVSNVSGSLNGATRVLAEPSEKFASRPRLNPTRKAEQAADNFKAVLLDTAEKAEQLSRSSNRRIADLLVWIINSMRDSQTFTPAAGPYFKPSVPVQLLPPERPHQNSSVFSID